jgi:hypothetical protein
LPAEAARELAAAGISAADLAAFSAQEHAILELGLVLYPRYYPAGEPNLYTSYIPPMESDQNRVYFLLLGEHGPEHMNLRLGERYLPAFLHAEFVLVLGCSRGTYTEVQAFLPLEAGFDPVFSAENTPLACD